MSPIAIEENERTLGYRELDLDDRGLGWFSLFVALTVAPVCVQGLFMADSILAVWLPAMLLLNGVR